jgi:hypothetical protein
MTATLSQSERDRLLDEAIGLTLDNFSLAWRVADLLIAYAAASVPPPQAIVRLIGRARSVEIPGQSCGFFTTPVIQMAVLDCRRSLEFFGLTRDSKTNVLRPIQQRRTDDLGIEHFGLPWVTPETFLAVVRPETCLPPEQLLAEVHHWSNKQLAHFTLQQPSLKLETIRDVSKAMIAAYSQLLFDALCLPRPSIQPARA